MTTPLDQPSDPAVTVRFAPSPTGRLHLGNIRPAVLNWLMARHAGGTFILRLDDTDRERSTEAFAAAIREDLAWLGLAWAREVRQSDRSERYEAVAERLKREQRLYPCFETPDELDRRRKRQLARGAPPIYDRAALRLAPEERQRLISAGARPHWRFRLANTAGAEDTAPVPTHVSWTDAIRGPQAIDIGSLSDPVLIRADGTFLYTFTSVVDDIEFGVSHVIRGEDHVTNTAAQIEIFEALGARPPVFAHHSLIVAADGQALSKRLGSLAIADLRGQGLEALAIVAEVAQAGTGAAADPVASLDALARGFELGRFGRAPLRFDPAELAALNARVLASLPYSAVADRLVRMGVTGEERFWLAVRSNLSVFADARGWWDVVAGDACVIGESASLLAVARELLPPEPWDEATWPAWTGAIRARTGAKGRALFHPLRLALTGRDAGPELKLLLPLIGRERAAARLVEAASRAAS